MKYRMSHRMRVLATTTIAVVVLSTALANADHGGEDFVAQGTISGNGQVPYVRPCDNPTLMNSLQGKTQFLVAIPADTRYHAFTLTSDTGSDYIDVEFWRISGGNCNYLSHYNGYVPGESTHAMVRRYGFWDQTVAMADFTLTIDR